MDKCGYLNPDNTCNSTLLCDNLKCLVISSNFENVEQKAKSQIKSGMELLHDLKERRLHAVDFSLNYYRERLPGETIYEDKKVCVKKQDEGFYFFFDDAEKHCQWIFFNKTASLELANKIIASWG